LTDFCGANFRYYIVYIVKDKSFRLLWKYLGHGRTVKSAWQTYSEE